MLVNVEEFYNSKTKAGKLAKGTDEGQDSIFVTTTSSNLLQYETINCYNCGEKGGTTESHISPIALTLAPHALKVAAVGVVEEEEVAVEVVIRTPRINLGLPNQESHM
eukprot:9963981-Ditylum_brightwellii.AAC.2